MRASPRHSGRRVAPALFAWLLAAACGDQSEPAPSAPVVPAELAAGASAVSTAIVLRGAVVTPDGALKQGYVGIVGGRIQSVSSRQPDIPGADVIRTDGIVIPGFVDLHNHVPWNVLPRWHPRRRYDNRYQWRVDPDYQQAAGVPFDHLSASHFCAMNAWGELRALVGGTTSILATQPVPCITAWSATSTSTAASTGARSSIASTSWPSWASHFPMTLRVEPNSSTPPDF